MRLKGFTFLKCKYKHYSLSDKGFSDEKTPVLRKKNRAVTDCFRNGPYQCYFLSKNNAKRPNYNHPKLRVAANGPLCPSLRQDFPSSSFFKLTLSPPFPKEGQGWFVKKMSQLLSPHFFCSTDYCGYNFSHRFMPPIAAELLHVAYRCRKEHSLSVVDHDESGPFVGMFR